MLEDQYCSWLDNPREAEPEWKYKVEDENGAITEHGFWAMDFYFPRQYAFERYGSCKSNPTSFKKDIDALVSHGFVDIIRKGGRPGNGSCKRESAVYRFSARWMEWTK